MGNSNSNSNNGEGGVLFVTLGSRTPAEYEMRVVPGVRDLFPIDDRGSLPSVPSSQNRCYTVHSTEYACL